MEEVARYAFPLGGLASRIDFSLAHFASRKQTGQAILRFRFRGSTGLLAALTKPILTCGRCQSSGTNGPPVPDFPGAGVNGVPFATGAEFLWGRKLRLAPSAS